MDIKPLTKPVWKTFLDAKLCSFTLPKKDLGVLRTEVSHLRDANFATNIFAENGERLGKDFFAIYPQNKKMFDFNIETAKNYRNKFRIGELLRLVSIMEMFENKINYMQLYSRETAIYFHAKYGFKSDITRFSHRDKTLETIAGDARFVDLAQKAKAIIKEVERCRVSVRLRELCKITSKLTDEYMQRVQLLSKDELNAHPFKEGFDMILTKETVLEKKDMFNKLFKQHGIDYKI